MDYVWSVYRGRTTATPTGESRNDIGIQKLAVIIIIIIIIIINR